MRVQGLFGTFGAVDVERYVASDHVEPAADVLAIGKGLNLFVDLDEGLLECVARFGAIAAKHTQTKSIDLATIASIEFAEGSLVTLLEGSQQFDIAQFAKRTFCRRRTRNRAPRASRFPSLLPTLIFEIFRHGKYVC